MRTNGYRNLTGIKIIDEAKFERGAEVIFKSGHAFELLRNNTFLVSVHTAKSIEKALKKKGIGTKRIKVISINELTPEERASIRRENLNGSNPVLF